MEARDVQFCTDKRVEWVALYIFQSAQGAVSSDKKPPPEQHFFLVEGVLNNKLAEFAAIKKNTLNVTGVFLLLQRTALGTFKHYGKSS